MQWCVEEALMLRHELEEKRADDEAENERRIADAQAQVAADLKAAA